MPVDTTKDVNIYLIGGDTIVVPYAQYQVFRTAYNAMLNANADSMIYKGKTIPANIAYNAILYMADLWGSASSGAVGYYTTV